MSALRFDNKTLALLIGFILALVYLFNEDSDLARAIRACDGSSILDNRETYTARVSECQKGVLDYYDQHE